MFTSMCMSRGAKVSCERLCIKPTVRGATVVRDTVGMRADVVVCGNGTARSLALKQHAHSLNK